MNCLHKPDTIKSVSDAPLQSGKSGLDVMFPENASAGFHLAQKIRGHERLARLPIVILSAVNTKFPLGFGPNDIDPAWMPVQDFVEKPVDLEVLASKVEKLTEQGCS